MSGSGTLLRVVDASALAQIFVAEPLEVVIRGLLISSGDDLLAPSIIATETAAAISKRLRRKAIDEESARKAFQALEEFLNRGPMKLVPANDLLGAAFDLSVRLHHALHDCIYIALAMRASARLVTCDSALASKAKSLRLAVDLVE